MWGKVLEYGSRAANRYTRVICSSPAISYNFNYDLWDGPGTIPRGIRKYVSAGTPCFVSAVFSMAGQRREPRERNFFFIFNKNCAKRITSGEWKCIFSSQRERFFSLSVCLYVFFFSCDINNDKRERKTDTPGQENVQNLRPPSPTLFRGA